ncbi:MULTISPECIES: HlyD family secretion protein [unclassified Nitrospina]|uniref:HlyD family secretion protein n=1 Tax=unclassified Nitrospina TaxID=2638683 RepID=UPI003F972763
MSNSGTNSRRSPEGLGLETGPFSPQILVEDGQRQSPSLVKVPKRLAGWARVTVLVFLIFAAFVIFVPWTQTITVQGQLSAYLPEQRPQKIHSRINGRILEWKANEGVHVAKGQIVLKLGDINPNFMAPDLIKRLDQSRRALEEQRNASLEQARHLEGRAEEMALLVEAALSKAEARISEAENKIQNIEQLIPPARGAVETARLNLARSRKLEEKGLLSRRELELAIQKMTETEAELKAAEAVLKEARNARQALVFDREKIQAELTQTLLDIRSKRAYVLSHVSKIASDLADLELKRSNAFQRNQAGHVVAPFEGTIVRLSALGPGEIVQEGDLLFTLVPKSNSPAVEMWANSIDAPLLRAGHNVRLLFQGVPAIPLPAWPELMAGTYDGRIKVVDKAVSSNGDFRLWVVPDTDRRRWPPQWQVRPGTNVKGWVMLNRVPLWYEIWRRINLFPPDYKVQNNKRFLETILPKAGRPRK